MGYFSKANKTLKREIAVALLVWLVYVVETKDASIIEVIVWPVFTFAALAFGLDWFNKSGGMRDQSSFPSDRRWPQCGSEYPDRERELSGGSHPDDPDRS